MTHDDEEQALLKALAATLTEDGELIATSEDEVADAEARGVEDVELPAHLAEWRDDDADDEAVGGVAEHADDDLQSEAATRAPIDLAKERQRRGLWTHGLAAVLGAAAAAVLAVQLQPDAPVVPTPPVAGDSATTTPTGEPPPPVPVEISQRCEDCCAGSACAGAAVDQQNCGSGRSCIPCSIEALKESKYRIRLGGIHLTELGRDAFARYPSGKPLMCVRVGASRETCVPTHVDDDSDRWNVVPMVVSAEELQAGLTLRMSWDGVAGPLGTAGSWFRALPVTPRALCSGHTAQLVTEGKEEVFATLSVFMDDAQHVELLRSGDVKALAAQAVSLKPSGFALWLQETNATGDARFVLTTQALDRPTAESVRWQLLEAGQQATVTVGGDYIGEPKIVGGR